METESKALTVQQHTIGELEKMAEWVVQSKLFAAITNKPQAMALMMLCQSEGLHPMAAVQRYYVVGGRPSMLADALLAEFQKHGGRIKWVQNTELICEGHFLAPGVDGMTAVKWTIQDAEKANLVKPNSGWQKFPRQMLKARVISEGVSMTMPGVRMGLVTKEEAQDMDPVYTEADVGAAPAAPAEPQQVDPVKLSTLNVCLVKLGFDTGPKRKAEIERRLDRKFPEGKTSRDLLMTEADDLIAAMETDINANAAAGQPEDDNAPEPGSEG